MLDVLSAVIFTIFWSSKPFDSDPDPDAQLEKILQIRIK